MPCSFFLLSVSTQYVSNLVQYTEVYRTLPLLLGLSSVLVICPSSARRYSYCVTLSLNNYSIIRPCRDARFTVEPLPGRRFEHLPSARCLLKNVMLSSVVELAPVCLAVWLVSVLYRQWTLVRDTLRDIG